MRRAIRDLLSIRNAIAAGFRIASGKASNHRTHVHAAAKLRLVHAESLEPAEQSLARRVRERPPIFDLMRARRLADEHQLRARDCACDRRAENIRTQPAGVQRLQMFSKSGYHSVR